MDFGFGFTLLRSLEIILVFEHFYYWEFNKGTSGAQNHYYLGMLKKSLELAFKGALEDFVDLVRKGCHSVMEASVDM